MTGRAPPLSGPWGTAPRDPGFTLLTVLAFVLMALAGHSARMSEPPPLERQTCWFEIPTDESAECYLLTMSGARRYAGVWTVRVPLAVLPSIGPETGVPLIFLDGGPGGTPFAPVETGSVASGMTEWWTQTRGLRQGRRLVLTGQRGTRYSQPLAECGPDDLVQSTNRYRMARREWRASSIERECLDRLGWKLVPFDTFTTEALADDVIEVLNALGAKRADLWGVSYGTTVALEVIARAPHRVRTAILDSPYPLHLADIDDGREFDDTLRRLFDDCRADEECNRHAPELESKFMALVADFDREPRYLLVPGANVAEEPFPVRLDGTDLAILIVVKMGWKTSEIELVPELIMALQEDWRGALEQEFHRDPNAARMFADKPVFRANAQATLILCRDTRFTDAMPTDSTATDLGSRLRILLSDYAICPEIGLAPAAPRPLPVSADIPVLILTGAYDWVTSPAMAEDLMRQFPQARRLIFANAAHAVGWSLFCPLEAMTAFLAAPRDPFLPACALQSQPPQFRWSEDGAKSD